MVFVVSKQSTTEPRKAEKRIREESSRPRPPVEVGNDVTVEFSQFNLDRIIVTPTVEFLEVLIPEVIRTVRDHVSLLHDNFSNEVRSRERDFSRIERTKSCTLHIREIILSCFRKFVFQQIVRPLVLGDSVLISCQHFVF